MDRRSYRERNAKYNFGNALGFRCLEAAADQGPQRVVTSLWATGSVRERRHPTQKQTTRGSAESPSSGHSSKVIFRRKVHSTFQT